MLKRTSHPLHTQPCKIAPHLNNNKQQFEGFESFTSDDDDTVAAAAAAGDAEADDADAGAADADDDDAWDAALTNFDEAADARDLAPTPEELAARERRRLARVDDEYADRVEITDIVAVDAPPRTEEDRLAALSAADAARLRGSRAAYTSFKMVRSGGEMGSADVERSDVLEGGGQPSMLPLPHAPPLPSATSNDNQLNPPQLTPCIPINLSNPIHIHILGRLRAARRRDRGRAVRPVRRLRLRRRLGPLPARDRGLRAPGLPAALPGGPVVRVHAGRRVQVQGPGD